MSNEIFQAIEQVGREKGIEVDIIIQAVEDAYAAAAKKYFRTKEDLGARFDRDTGSLAVFARKKIVDDVTNPDLEISPNEAEEMTLPANEEGIVEIPKPKEELAQLGRIAAQAAKQIIFQKVREAERDNVYKEYIGRAGELVNGVVKRFERGSIIIDLGRTEGILPKKEQSKAERYSQGDRVRAVIVDVDRNAKGPQVILSRTDERLLIKLFEMEVPEIYDGTVQIERAVHDPGDRAKVAVRSKDRDVDPVGACVGMKGSRVQSIIRELRGEKIDIVEFSDDVSTFVTNSLNPAKINRVQITDPENKTLEVVVDDEQLSLAIGKKGQNVRLASRLAGWKIDIKSEQEKKREVQAEMERMARDAREMAGLEGVSEKLVQKLQEGGVQSLDAITAFGIDGLTNVPGVGPKTAEKILAAAQAGLQARAELEEAERIEAERLAAEEAARQSEEQARLAEEAAAEEAARQAAESAAEAPAASAEDDEATEVGAEPSETDEDAAGPAAEEAATPHGETLDSTAGERREGD
ncbi:MAG TPA: transcription termination factor NusA [Candidatus Dormibacteraeota bacterium]|nr:transcription termination factor NusA [Candidatus Dormibacteraeota bacterium]